VSRPQHPASDFLTELFRAPLDPGYAQAARRRALGAPPPTGWRRGVAQGTRVAALAVIGFLLAVSYQYAAASQPETSRARAGLVADVRARRQATDELQKHADKLREDVVRERDAALSGDGEAARLQILDAHTGLAKVRGDGVVVRLVDAPTPVDPVTGKRATTNPGRVLDRDLQDIANELWRLGAEAIAVNGERVTVSTAILDIGGSVLVNSAYLSPPYQISAIGPKDTYTRLSQAPAFVAFVRARGETFGVQISFAQPSDITIPAFAGSLNLRYGRPGSAPAPPSGAP